MADGRVEFGGRLRELIELTGMTREDFGKACGVDRATVQGWLVGDGAPGSKALRAMAQHPRIRADLNRLVAGLGGQAQMPVTPPSSVDEAGAIVRKTVATVLLGELTSASMEELDRMLPLGRTMVEGEIQRGRERIGQLRDIQKRHRVLATRDMIPPAVTLSHAGIYFSTGDFQRQLREATRWAS